MLLGEQYKCCCSTPWMGGWGFRYCLPGFFYFLPGGRKQLSLGDRQNFHLCLILIISFVNCGILTGIAGVACHLFHRCFLSMPGCICSARHFTLIICYCFMVSKIYGSVYKRKAQRHWSLCQKVRGFLTGKQARATIQRTAWVWF